MNSSESNPETPGPVLIKASDDVSTGLLDKVVHREGTAEGVLKGVRDVDRHGESFSADIPDVGAPRVRLEVPGAGTTVTQPTNERMKDRFCDYATQYYVAGRFAARAWLTPVHGNQFHHAVELYLKAALVGTLTLAQLESRMYRHDLRALWKALKRKANEPALDRFDSTIRTLHQFESIRYPEKIAREGAILAISWRRGDVGPISGTMKMPPRYEVIIGEVDELVIELVDRAGRNPDGLLLRYGNAPGVRDVLTHENPYAARWV